MARVKASLNETITEHGKTVEVDQAKLPKGVLRRVRYPICHVDELNGNKRIYEKQVWDNVLADPDISEKLSHRNLFGDAEHPKDSRLRLNKDSTSHVVHQVVIEGKDVYADLDIINFGAGQFINALMDAGCDVGTSTRAEGELEERIDENSGDKYFWVVPESYKFTTIDFTADPSTVNAYPVGVQENILHAVQEALDNHQLNESFAKEFLERINMPESKRILESITHDKHHKDCKCKVSSKQCAHGCPKAIKEAKGEEFEALKQKVLAYPVVDIKKVIDKLGAESLTGVSNIKEEEVVEFLGMMELHEVGEILKALQSGIKEAVIVADPEIETEPVTKPEHAPRKNPLVPEPNIQPRPKALIDEAKVEAGEYEEMRGSDAVGQVTLDKDTVGKMVKRPNNQTEDYIVQLKDGTFIAVPGSKIIVESIDEVESRTQGLSDADLFIQYYMALDKIDDVTGQAEIDKLVIWRDELLAELRKRKLMDEGDTGIDEAKDKFGRNWDLPKAELCPTCGQPDNTGNCNHKKLTDEEVEALKESKVKSEKALGLGKLNEASEHSLDVLKYVLIYLKNSSEANAKKAAEVIGIPIDKFKEEVKVLQKKSLNENIGMFNFDNLRDEMEKVTLKLIPELKRKQILTESKTAKELLGNFATLLRESYKAFAMVSAERDKAIEIAESKILEFKGNYTKDVLAFNTKISMGEKGFAALQEKLDKLTQEAARQPIILNENKVKLESAFKVKLQAAVTEAVVATTNSLKGTLDKKLVEVKESYEAKFVNLTKQFEREKKNILLEYRLERAGLTNLSENTLTLLRRAKDDKDLERLIEAVRYSLKENMLHSNIPSKMNIITESQATSAEQQNLDTAKMLIGSMK